MRILHLNLKFKFYDQIECGDKKFEYRLVEKWAKRIENQHYDAVRIVRGYTTENMLFKFKKPEKVMRVSECYGEQARLVYKIPVDERYSPEL